MTPKEIRQQIRQIERQAKIDVAALERQLSLTASGFEVGDKLESIVNGGWQFRVTGATDEGLIGVLSRPHTITPKKFDTWKKK